MTHMDRAIEAAAKAIYESVDQYGRPPQVSWEEMLTYGGEFPDNKALVLFYVEGGTTDFVPYSRLRELGHTGTGDVARLRPWGLVESDGAHTADGHKAGNWRVTDLGERFIKGQATVPKYLWLFDGHVMEQGGPQVTRVHHPL
jgi:hypothetical protein